jgi:hypothetical protein
MRQPSLHIFVYYEAAQPAYILSIMKQPSLRLFVFI